jgi:hypothetical protein
MAADERNDAALFIHEVFIQSIQELLDCRDKLCGHTGIGRIGPRLRVGTHAIDIVGDLAMRVLHARDVRFTGPGSDAKLRPDHMVLGGMMVVQRLGDECDVATNSAGAHGVTGLDVQRFSAHRVSAATS